MFPFAAEADSAAARSFHYVCRRRSTGPYSPKTIAATCSSAVSLAVSAAGGATATVRVLLTPEEIDTAAKKTIEYRAPGR
jgi:hypothetical protein